MRMKLNKRAVDRGTYQGPGADYRWHTELPGFGLRIYASEGPGRVAVLKFRDTKGHDAELPAEYGAGLYVRVGEDERWQDSLAEKIRHALGSNDR